MSVYNGDVFFIHSSTLVTSAVFGNSHSSGCDLMSHCGFDLLSLMISEGKHHVIYLATCMSKKMSLQILSPFFICVCVCVFQAICVSYMF